MIEVKGETAAGWGPVADAFRANFEHHGEVGASCCVYVDGRPVVDVWGGVADVRTRRPWDQDTVAVVMSTTKGATAICAHMLREHGDLDLDAPVVRYWPEFGAEGKGATRVRWLLSHQAGLPVIDVPLTLDEACAWEPVIRALEAQKPLWEPGTQHAYHALTYGFLIGEVIRRVTGRTVGKFFAEEVAGPLALSAWIGLPDGVEDRLAHLEHQPVPDFAATFEAVLERLPDCTAVPEEASVLLEALWRDPNSVAVRAHTLGGAFGQIGPDDRSRADRAYRAAEFPASNMVTDARSLARMYAAMVAEVDGIRLVNPETVESMCVVQTSRSAPYGIPPGLTAFFRAMEAPFSSGFVRPSRSKPLLGPSSFGHPGAGGSLGMADADAGVGFGYVMNYMIADGRDRRAANLLGAVHGCIG